jgi:hypothetical protein
MPAFSGVSAEKGAIAYGRLSPGKRDYFNLISAKMADGCVLMNKDLEAALQVTGNRRNSYRDASRSLDSFRASDILWHLKVMLRRGAYGDVPLVTYHDLQLPPAQTNITEVAHGLGSLQPGDDLSPWQQYDLEAWYKKAQEDYEKFRANVPAE